MTTNDGALLLLTTMADERAIELEKRLRELHPYACPEIVTIVPERVDADYLAWLLGACAPQG